MPDVSPTDALMRALQEKAQRDAIVLPDYLGRTNSVVVVPGPKVRFVLSADVLYHELDIDDGVVVGLLESIRQYAGDALTEAEQTEREERNQLVEELAIARDQLKAAQADLKARDVGSPEVKVKP